ncbi:MAG: porin, partial [Methylococcales bacterium]
HTKLVMAIAATLTVTTSFSALALDLYVDSKTKQVFTEPGKGRVLLGDSNKVSNTPFVPTPVAAPAADIEAIKKDLELKTNEIKALTEKADESAKPDAVKVSLTNGVKFETRDGNFTTEIHGRMQVDSQENVNQQLHNSFVSGTGAPLALDNSVGIRRARLSMEGTVYKDTDYKFEYDFARAGMVGGTGATVANTQNTSLAGGITDAFARYNFNKKLSVKLGSFKEPLTLEDTTSDIQTSFIERSMAVNAFVDNLNIFKVGIGANYSADRWLVATALQTQGPGAMNGATSYVQPTVNSQSGAGNTSWELNGRVAGTPWMASPTQLLHVGGWGSYTSVNNNMNGGGSLANGGVAFGTQMGNMDRTSILNTGNLSASATQLATAYNRFGAETAVVLGPFSAQAEYLQTNVSGNGYSNNSMGGYYGYVTYFVTGESRNYVTKTGAFDRVKPKHNFDMKGGMGAWELLAGFDELNLKSGDKINGGSAELGKLGINWYFNPRVRLNTNYVHAFNINTTGMSGTGTPAAFNNAKLDMIESRIQLDW